MTNRCPRARVSDRQRVPSRVRACAHGILALRVEDSRLREPDSARQHDLYSPRCAVDSQRFSGPRGKSRVLRGFLEETPMAFTQVHRVALQHGSRTAPIRACQSDPNERVTLSSPDRTDGDLGLERATPQQSYRFGIYRIGKAAESRFPHGLEHTPMPAHCGIRPNEDRIVESTLPLASVSGVGHARLLSRCASRAQCHSQRKNPGPHPRLSDCSIMRSIRVSANSTWSSSAFRPRSTVKSTMWMKCVGISAPSSECSVSPSRSRAA